GDTTKDIRYQNPNPSTYGAKIKSIVVDNSNNLSQIAYHDLNVDWTPPVFSYVYDGNQNFDIDTITDNTSFSAYWQANDPNSGILEYYYSIGTSMGNDNIIGWTYAGTNNYVTLTNINLTYGETYYFNVRAKNNAGLIQEISSDGFVLSPTNLPHADFYAIQDTVYLPNAIVLFVNQSQNAVSYLWDFGDGHTSTQVNPWHQYTQAGTYSVQLIAMNPPLPNDTLLKENYIHVFESSNVLYNQLLEPEVHPTPAKEYIYIKFTESFVGIISIYNEYGKNVFIEHYNNVNKIKIDLNKLSSGIYLINIIDLKYNKNYCKKIIK
ncbi:MAG: PKD domain-containing protein, partial [Bacteroidales bacterium]|nr:PKD domain-containing protein [Bacteroidales bacterium]